MFNVHCEFRDDQGHDCPNFADCVVVGRTLWEANLCWQHAAQWTALHPTAYEDVWDLDGEVKLGEPEPAEVLQ